AGLDPQTATTAVATTYVTAGGHFQRPPAPFNGPATPAGGAYASVGDLLNFAQALTAHRLISEQNLRLAWTKQSHGEAADYGFGFQLRDDSGVTEIGHTGGGPGENGALWILGGGKAVIVVLSNVAPIWRGDKLAAFIASRVPLR
ncbi:MAG: serine hydrolase, partial [Phenylobacterium sp.]